MDGHVITIASTRLEMPERVGGRLPTCHGCKGCWYTAPGGLSGDYPGRPEIVGKPHSRCTKLAAYVPMVVDERGKWLASVVPPGCPEFRQRDLPGLTS